MAKRKVFREASVVGVEPVAFGRRLLERLNSPNTGGEIGDVQKVWVSEEVLEQFGLDCSMMREWEGKRTAISRLVELAPRVREWSMSHLAPILLGIEDVEVVRTKGDQRFIRALRNLERGSIFFDGPFLNRERKDVKAKGDLRESNCIRLINGGLVS